MSSYQYRKSHYGDKTILRPSYLHNGISYTGKMASLYWIRALFYPNRHHTEIFPYHMCMHPWTTHLCMLASMSSLPCCELSTDTVGFVVMANHVNGDRWAIILPSPYRHCTRWNKFTVKGLNYLEHIIKGTQCMRFWFNYWYLDGCFCNCHWCFAAFSCQLMYQAEEIFTWTKTTVSIITATLTLRSWCYS